MTKSSEAKTISSSVPAPERVFLLPSYFCLEAPFVATGWSVLFLQANSSSPRIFLLAGLFLATWAVYLFDRLYDTRSNARVLRQSLRHQFAREHRSLLLWLFGFSLAGATGCLFGLDASLFPQAVLVGILVILYFLIFRLLQHFRSVSLLPCKEIFIALCFTESICLAAGHRWLTDPWIPPSVFFLLVLSNCNLISFREAMEDRQADKTAFFSASRGSFLIWVLAPIALALALSLSILFSGSWYLTGLSGAFSAVCLSTVWLKARSELTQAFADLSMLSPILFLGLDWLCRSIGQAVH